MKGANYYHVSAGTKPRRWTALGSDWSLALRQYADIEGNDPPAGVALFRDVVKRYRREIMPGKAFGTQKRNGFELARLESVFGAVPIEQITPRHVREYLDTRGAMAKASANREKALLSHVLNWARQWGYTNAANPCAGVRGFSEPGRDRYVTDAEFRAVWNAADSVVRDVMDLCYYTAQRPGDVLAMQRADIAEGAIAVRQAKTGKRIRIEIVGPLADVVERIRLRTRDRVGTTLIQDENGRRVSVHMLRSRFDRAREKAGADFQLRDLRAKAATDLDDLGNAQKLLGHATRGMTEHYAGRRIGEKVRPVTRHLE